MRDPVKVECHTCGHLVTVAESDVGSQDYNGNSVSYWYAKAKSYGNIVHGIGPKLARAEGETLAAAADRLASRAEKAERERDEARETARIALADAARQADRAQEAEAGWASARRTNCDYNRTIAEIERERDEARAALAVERQHRDGHLPSCAGIDREEGRCGCGYLDGTAYRDMTARMEQATALLREVQDDSINGLTLGEARALYERVNEFLAGQPAPAKPVVDDAMVDRACRVLDPDWDRRIDDADDNHNGELSNGMIATRNKARAALVAALEGMT